ncbi:biotin/lipoyl-containing protein [Acidisoma cladoniae]|uniref:biotin/lipoyl-containing protein n=1 Tax=Acidisoma cladoniae TaxID=3040935 RepID=UPI0025518FF1|nr:biotin/lipoyl-containing protein [Acidisoma sp. PAMC 29798]
MEIELVMPMLGEDVIEGQMRTWVKSEGDSVIEGEVVAVISTPKLDMDLESPATGVLQTIVVDEDEVAAVGATLAIIDTDEDEDGEDDDDEADEDEEKDA